MNMFELAKQPLTVGQVLDSGFKLYTSSLKSVIGFGLIIGIISSLPGLLMTLSPLDPANPDSNFISLYAYMLGSMALTATLYGSMISRIHSFATHQTSSFGSAFKVGLKRAFPLIFGTLLYMLIMMLGMILLIIPGLYLMITLMFFMYVMIAEDKGIIDSLKASHQLVKGSWWRTMGVMTVLMIIYMVIGLVIGLTLGTGMIMGMGTEGDIANQINWTLQIVNIVIYTFIYPMMSSVFLVLYKDLTLRKEGGDLMARMG